MHPALMSGQNNLMNALRRRPDTNFSHIVGRVVAPLPLKSFFTYKTNTTHHKKKKGKKNYKTTKKFFHHVKISRV
jgi:hypothetical protein